MEHLPSPALALQRGDLVAPESSVGFCLHEQVLERSVKGNYVGAMPAKRDGDIVCDLGGRAIPASCQSTASRLPNERVLLDPRPESCVSLLEGTVGREAMTMRVRSA